MNATSARATTATSRRAMVVTGHPEATRAAWAALTAGGGVVDAAIAGAAALAVTQPQACTLGGDAFILVHDATSGHTEGLNASGPSPALATRDRFGTTIPQRGGLTVNVPGVVAGWEALHRRYGKLAWADVIAPAIRLAREGFAVTKNLARSTEVYAQLLDSSPATRALFRPAGKGLAIGDRLVQSALAATLERIAIDGAKVMYEGAIPASLAGTVEAAGGCLRASDFTGYAPEWVAPLEVGYRGHRVRAMPPNAFGLYLLLQLQALEDARIATTDLANAERLVALAQAAQAAFAVGSRAIADPKFAPEPAAALLGAKGRERMQAARGERPPNRGGTAVLSVVDAAGNAVTLVQSVFLVFGSGVLDPETGILLSNRMIGFTTEAGHPNEVGPRKRPAHTLCPAMAFDAQGALRYALATPGGPGQTITLSQVLQAVLDAGVSLEAAINAPRWSMDLGAQALVESTMPAATIERARALGIAFDHAPPDSPFFGSAEGIERRADGLLTGVADFRRDATTYGE